MSTDQKVIRENSLLEARAEALRAAERKSLRPLGKLWGMDVFTWYDPHVTELSATISTFPFPVFWLGNARLVRELGQVDPASMRALTWCGQFDDAYLQLPADVLAPMPLVTATETLDDALEILRHVKQPRHILLFTVSGNEWKTKLSDFEAFVKLNSDR
jgi:hypothetical protein